MFASFASKSSRALERVYLENLYLGFREGL